MLAEQLYRAIADLAPSVDPKAALALGERHWPEIAARDPNPYDAETCRLLSLAVVVEQPSDALLADVWRTRALTRFALTGWHEGVASVAMGRSFVALAHVNNDYRRGVTLDVLKGSQAAVDILDELKPFLQVPSSGISVGPRSPSQPVLARFLHEKRGFLLMLLGLLDEARESYELAASVAEGNARGTVKVQLGRVLVEYIAGAHETALAETRTAVGTARELGRDGEDLVEIGEHNIAVMERGGRDLRPYEIL